MDLVIVVYSSISSSSSYGIGVYSNNSNSGTRSITRSSSSSSGNSSSSSSIQQPWSYIASVGLVVWVDWLLFFRVFFVALPMLFNVILLDQVSLFCDNSLLYLKVIVARSRTIPLTVRKLILECRMTTTMHQHTLRAHLRLQVPSHRHPVLNLRVVSGKEMIGGQVGDGIGEDGRSSKGGRRLQGSRLHDITGIGKDARSSKHVLCLNSRLMFLHL